MPDPAPETPHQGSAQHHDRERLRAVLEEAIHDEFKARATYRQVIARFGPVRPFLPILASEQRHIKALTGLFRRHGLPVPADDWEQRVAVPDSLQEACRAGVQGEIENAALYERLLEQSLAYPDVQAVLGNLRRASQENHLRAFQRCSERQAGTGRTGHGSRHRGGRGSHADGSSVSRGRGGDRLGRRG
jgi:hypothetical protein